MDYDESCFITINSGTLIVSAQGDGVDSNGDINFNGGVVIVYGPTSGGDGALDCGGGIYYNGGTLLAIGSSGMAEGADSESEGYSFKYNGDSISENTLITLVNNSTGDVLFSTTTPKQISSIVFGDESLTDGAEIAIYTGGVLTGAEDMGEYQTGGTLTDGTLVETVTLSGKATSAGTSGGMGMGGGFGGGGHRGGGQGGGREGAGETATQAAT